MRKLFFIFLCLFCTISGFAQQEVLYKQIEDTDTTKLFLEIIYPTKVVENKSYPAMVYFFGGAWMSGDREQFREHAIYFSKKELVNVLVDYRILHKHKTSPFESLKDAKSAIRFIRKNAKQYQIDPDKIIGVGGSAGGHLAAASALIDGYNESSDDLSIDASPNALVLYCPVLDNGPGGFGYPFIGNQYKHFSPLFNIKKGAPPTIIFLGADDQLVSVEMVKYYKSVMEKVKSRCDLKIYPDENHYFLKNKKSKTFAKVLTETDEFIQSLGYY